MRTAFAFLCLSIYLFGQSFVWELKQSGSSLGNPIITDPHNKKIVYYGSNSAIYKSVNAGENFTTYGVAIPNATKIKSMIVNKKDGATMLVAVKGSSSDQIVKTTNGGQTWTVSATGLSFSYFGIPMTQDPSHPDTIYTMSGSNFMASNDFGSTWRTVSSPSNFGSPCDIEVFPDSSNIILVGDNTTGIFRSSDYGRTWQTKFTTSGEIPTIAISRQKGSVCYATRWGGGGGVLRSTDYGNTWVSISFFNGINMWGVDVANDNPNFVITGKYSGNGIYISTNGGVSWKQTYIGGSNYSVFYVDMDNIYAAQSTGFYKLKDVKGSRSKVYATTVSGSEPYGTVNLRLVNPENVQSTEIQVSDNKIDFQPVQRKVFKDDFEPVDNLFSSGFSFSGEKFVRVKIDFVDGSSELTESIKIGNNSAKRNLTARAYPNPFNPSTKLNFSVEEGGNVDIMIFNSLGEQLQRSSMQLAGAGNYSQEVNLASHPSGIYFYQLQLKTQSGVVQSLTGKLLLQK